MDRTWILVADDRLAKFCEAESPDGELHVLDVIRNVGGVGQFVRGLIDRLHWGRRKGAFNRLVLVAPDGVLSRLRAEMDRDLTDLLELDLQANLVRKDKAVIRSCLPHTI